MILSQEAKTYLANRGATAHRWLLWIEAKNRITGAMEHVGFWNGADDRVFEVAGVDRTYIGIGDLLKIPSVTDQPGPIVRLQQVDLMGISDQLELAILQYDTRQAPVEIHLALFDPETLNLVTIEQVHTGWLDKAPAKFGGLRGTSGIRASIASISRLLTRPLYLKKSDAAQSRRLVNGEPDRFRRYGSVSGSVATWWGEKRAVSTPPNTTVNGPSFGDLLGFSSAD